LCRPVNEDSSSHFGRYFEDLDIPKLQDQVWW
jgi:hypothetical protein